LQRLLTWIRLPKLRLHYFNDLAVKCISGFAGQPIQADVSTTSRERTCNARACVEIDLSKPLFGKYELNDTEYEIIYESLSEICTCYGLYGHVSTNCKGPDEHMEMDEALHTSPLSTSKHTEDVADWMMGDNKSRNWKPLKIPSARPNPPIPTSAASGSCFEALSQQQIELETAPPPPPPRSN
ncbi:hypothetical protein LINGRAHAP2_LOCUS29003, partial [Linum grandiflorum]